MAFFDVQNPGIGGIDELTNAEELFLTSLAGLPYSEGDILYYTGGFLVNLGIGSEGQVLAVSSGVPAWVDNTVSTAVLTATGTVDDTNTDFTFTEKPKLVNVNGTFYTENNGWSWSAPTATLDGPVGTGGLIFGLR